MTTTASNGSYVGSLPIDTAAKDKIFDGIQELLARRNKALATDVTSATLSNMSDGDWVKQAFLVDSSKLDPIDRTNRTFTRAAFKFNDSSLGGSYAINPRPQFTPYADIRAKSNLRKIMPVSVAGGPNINSIGYTPNLGIGRYYSEAIDDSAQVIHMRFGVPQFNSLTTFFTGFFNSYAASVARTGRGALSLGGIAYIVGTAIGLVVNVVCIPLLLLNAVGNLSRFFLKKPSSKFYYLKPTMITYWSAVNTMVNQIGVNRGLYPKIPVLGEDVYNPSMQNGTNQQIGEAYRIDTDTMNQLSRLMPDVFSPSGGIDVYSAASRAQRLKNKWDRDFHTLLNSAAAVNASDVVDPLGGLGFIVKDPNVGVPQEVRERKRDFAAAIGAWFSSFSGKLNSDGATSATPDESGEGALSKSTDAELNPRSVDLKTGEVTTPADTTYAEYFAAEWDDGTAFASFKVDYTGSVSESFSNSAQESDLQSKFNSTSSQARSARFTFADGNVAGGVAGAAINGIKDVVQGLASGVMDSLSISGLMSLGGSAFVDIPKHWENSTATMSRSTYTMTLISPYGNPVSQIINIYIPLCMILAAALPLATGKQSYTAPFLVEMYDRGRQQTRLGMIDSLSVTRGTSNLGFNRDGNAMAMEVSFSVMDLSSVLTMPVAQGFSFLNPLKTLTGITDDENNFTDYMATLSSLSMPQQFYQWNKLKLNVAKKIRSLDMLHSPAAWMAMAHDYTPVGWLDIAFRGAQRQ